MSQASFSESCPLLPDVCPICSQLCNSTHCSVSQPLSPAHTHTVLLLHVLRQALLFFKDLVGFDSLLVPFLVYNITCYQDRSFVHLLVSSFVPSFCVCL